MSGTASGPSSAPSRRAVAVTTIVLAALLGGAVWLVTAGTHDPLPPPDAVVGLQEYAIAIPDTFEAGSVVLELVNTGHAHHNFTLCPANDAGDGCGDAPRFFDMLQRPAEARDQSFYKDRADSIVIGKRWQSLIEYDLELGTYYVYCAIYTHDARGMNDTITVAAAAPTE